MITTHPVSTDPAALAVSKIKGPGPGAAARLLAATRLWHGG